MLEREFMELTGMSSADAHEEYAVANGMYMSTNLDKEPFCKEYMKMKKDGNVLAQEFYTYLEHLERKHHETQKRNEELLKNCDRLTKELADAQVRHEQALDEKECACYEAMENFKHHIGEQLVDALYAKSDEQTFEQVRKVAIGLCSPEHYLCHITKQGYEMRENDKNLLVEILSNIG